MSRFSVAPALLLAMGALAGCLGSDDAGRGDLPDPGTAGLIPDAWWLTAVPSSLLDEAHEHGNRSHHLGLTTANFRTLGWDPLVTEHYGETLTGMGCGGAVDRADGRRLAIVHSIATDVSFVVADITDPAQPRMVGEFFMPNAVIWDADITADGNHVLVGAYPYFIFGLTNPQAYVPALPPPVAGLAPAGLDLSGTISFAGNHAKEAATRSFPAPLPDAELAIYYRDACTGTVRNVVGPEQYAPFGPGLVMVGIQDPENPVLEDWRSQPAVGPHSVSSALLDGTVWATASVTNLNHEASYYSLYHVVETPAGSKLDQVAHLPAPGIGSRVPPPVTTNPVTLAFSFVTNGHIDVFLAKHLVDGRTYGYLANGHGMYVVDLDNPRVPRVVGSWMNDHPGALHTTYTFPAMWGDRYYMIAAEEVGEPVELPSGWVYILDVTDPAAPAEVGRWTLPVKPKWDDGGLQFSPHYVAVLNTTMFVTNYHGGMWAVDIADPAAPLAKGLFVPPYESPSPFGSAATHSPSLEDVIVHADGVLTTWDGAGGVYQLRFDEAMPAPRAPAWGMNMTAEHQH